MMCDKQECKDIQRAFDLGLITLERAIERTAITCADFEITTDETGQLLVRLADEKEW
jgi:hypothetical protein